MAADRQLCVSKEVLLKEEKVKNSCICKKPNSTIFCRFCGNLMYGRVKQICQEHPQTLFLMDLEQCTRCRASYMLLQDVTDPVK